MCQATVYLNGKEILRDVLMVEDTPEGIRLSALFEPARVVPATLRRVDLIKHQVILETAEPGSLPSIASEVDKLRVLIPHWVEHNAEHVAEFRRYASRGGEAAAGILDAAEAMQQANLALSAALVRLGGPLSHEDPSGHP